LADIDDVHPNHREAPPLHSCMHRYPAASWKRPRRSPQCGPRRPPASASPTSSVRISCPARSAEANSLSSSQGPNTSTPNRFGALLQERPSQPTSHRTSSSTMPG
jgi:hypothetical protein